MFVSEDKVRKPRKAAGPSGITVEMMKAKLDDNGTTITKLSNCIIRDGRIPNDWIDSFIINLFKGKGDALVRI